MATAAGDDMQTRVAVLGPLELQRNGTHVELRASRPKALLALLAIRQGRPVSVECLVDELWEGEPPSGARATLQSYISNLRRDIEPDIVQTSGSGYALGSAVQLDLNEFETQLRKAHQELDNQVDEVGNRSAVLKILQQADQLWRGEFVQDLRPMGRLDRFALVAEEKKLAATSLRLELAVDLSPQDAISELRMMRIEHPFEEKFVALVTKALALTGRQVEALREFQDFRSSLAENTGLTPSSSIEDLEHTIAANQIKTLVAASSHIAGTGSELASDLPLPPATSLVEREDHLDAVRRELRSARLVTLVGPGGSGKTRLALEVACELQAEYDQIRFVDLSVVQEAAAVCRQVRTASLSVTHTPDPQQSILLVVDNCEHVVAPVASELSVVLSEQASLSILATSRTRLNLVSEAVLNVPPLTTEVDHEVEGLSPAGTLLTDRVVSAGGTVSESDWPMVEQIVATVDGLPHAVEMVARNAAALGVRTFAGRLDSQLPGLQFGEVSDGHRHRNLDSIVGWSWDHLDDQAARLLSALSVFEGSFDLGAAEAVGEAAGVDAALTLPVLIDSSLVSKQRSSYTSDRFRLLRTVREFAARQVGDQDLLVAVNKHFVDHYARRAKTIGATVRQLSPAQWRSVVTPDQPNMLAALRLAYESDSFSAGVDLLWIFLWRHHELGELIDLRHWVEESATAVLLADNGDNTESRSRLVQAYIESAGFAFHIGDYGRTAEPAGRAVSEARAFADPTLLADALSVQGAAAVFEGRLDVAFRALAEAETFCRETGHLWGLAVVDLFRATAERRAGEFTNSEISFRRTLDRFAYLGDERGVVIAEAGRARTLHELGNVDEARKHAERSFGKAQRIADNAALAMASVAYGRVVTCRKEFDQGRMLFIEALSAGAAIGNRTLVSSSLEWIGYITAAKSGDYGPLAFVDGFTSEYRGEAIPVRPNHDKAIVAAQRCLDDDIFASEQHRGAAATLQEVCSRLDVHLEHIASGVEKS